MIKGLLILVRDFLFILGVLTFLFLVSMPIKCSLGIKKCTFDDGTFTYESIKEVENDR